MACIYVSTDPKASWTCTRAPFFVDCIRLSIRLSTPTFEQHAEDATLPFIFRGIFRE